MHKTVNVIIQGFASGTILFEKFQKAADVEFIVLENRSHTCTEVKTRLDELVASGRHLNIFAWSLGSLLAMEWMIKNKCAGVRSLFMTGATARFTNRPGYAGGVDDIILKKMVHTMKSKKNFVLRGFYDSILRFVEDRRRYAEELIKTAHETAGLFNGLDLLLNMDLLGSVASIDTKVLICQGSNDTTTPARGARILNELIEGSALKLYDGGHCYFLEKPEECFKEWKTLL
jgi:pimeloyl-ACP methyl ester carboxylesterase